jgi:hypothetical protein
MLARVRLALEVEVTRNLSEKSRNLERGGHRRDGLTSKAASHGRE